MDKFNILYFYRTLRYPTWQSLIPWTTERAGQLCAKNYHIRNIYLDRFKNKFENATLLFQIEMLTSSIIMLSVFGGLVAVLVMWRCISCIQGLYTKWKHPGQERDTFRYKTSGMVLDCCCGIFFKLPISIFARMCCPEDNVIHV